EKGHYSRECLSERSSKTKPRNVNLIEVFTDDEEEEETSEVYAGERSRPYTTDRKNARTRQREMTRTSELNKEMNLKTRVINPIEMEVEPTPKQKPVKKTRNPSRIDNLAPYNIADDILSKQSSATLRQWLQISAQRRNLANALRRHLISTPS
ncbi:4043_t:CDS:1, partial [Funneliformis mosseae]